MSTLKDRFIAFHKILGATALCVALAGCSSDEPVNPPVPEDDSGCEIGYRLTVSGDEESRCVADATNDHSYEFNTANFRANLPMVQMRLEYENGAGYTTYGSHWCVNLPSIGDYRTANANAAAASYSVNDFTHSPNYWQPDRTTYVYAMTGHTNCNFTTEGGMPDFSETGTAASLGDRLIFDNFRQWGYHPVDLLFGYGKARKSYVEYRANPRIDVVFNHAMAKLTFTIANNNPNIIVRVDNIRIGNIYTKGRFNYNNAMSIMGWNADNIGNINGDNVGQVWTNLDEKTVLSVNQELAKMGSFTVANGEEKTPWTAFDKAFFYTIVPQEVAKWTPSAKGNPCLILDCVITDTANGKVIWSSDGSNGIYIPMTNSTETTQKFLPGRHYHYKITFPNNTDWNDGGWDANGNPVLVPVGITAAVGDWIGEDWGHWNPTWWN